MEQFMKLLPKINDNHTLGLIIVEKEFHNENNLEFDAVLIKITSGLEQSSLLHFNIGSKSIELQVVNEKQISQSLICGKSRRLVEWLMNGKIIAEKNAYITQLRKSILMFPINNRKYKIGVEFCKLIRRNFDGKRLFNQGNFLDAFNAILHSLHHLARISVIEHGIYPEVTVWQQVKHVEPEVYKLYEEMVTGEESLKKRIELLLIASNFAITSKTKLGASHLLEIMKENHEPWSINNLLNHNELKGYGCDLTVMIEYLVQKGVIDIVKVETDIKDVFLRLYCNK